MKRLKFSVEGAQLANEKWGFNFGPSAVAAMCGLYLDELRPYLGDFE